MSPAQLARRLDSLADKLASRRVPALAFPAQSRQAAPAIPLGDAVAAMLHAVSGDVRARIAPERAGSTEAAQ